MHCPSMSGKQHLPFHNTKQFIGSGSNLIFVFHIFNDDMIALLGVYVLI